MKTEKQDIEMVFKCAKCRNPKIENKTRKDQKAIKRFCNKCNKSKKFIAKFIILGLNRKEASIRLRKL